MGTSSHGAGGRGLYLGLLLLLGAMLGAAGCAKGGGHVGSGPLPLAAQVKPASDTIRLLRNAHYFKLMGRSDLALKELEEAYQQDPRNLKVANALAQCYDELGAGEKARQIYGEALTWDGGNPALTNNLCYSYYLAGDLKQAEACFRQTLSRQPHNARARNNLGLLLCRQGRQDEALQLWREGEGEAAAVLKLNQALAALGQEKVGDEAGPPLSPRPQVVAEIPPPGGQSAQTRVAARPQVPQASVPTQASGSPSPRSPEVAAQKSQPVAAPLAPAPPAPGEARLAKPFSSPEGQSPEPMVPMAPRSATPPEPQAPAVASQVFPAPEPPQPVMLTTAELVATAIEVRNGNGSPDLAHQARSLLSLEGFTVIAIGNHVDFGMARTTISYRPQVEKVARALQGKFFPGASLKGTDNLKGEADIQIILGHDLREHPDILALLAGCQENLSAPPSPPLREAPPAKSSLRPEAHGAGPLAAAPSRPATSPEPQAPVASSQSSPGPKPLGPVILTTAELVATAIEVRNGNGSPDLAHQARSLLSLGGFNVVAIANHVDFGMAQTTISYRPQVEKVARALQGKFFPGASLKGTANLKGEADIQIILGHDLREHPDILARLAGCREENL